MKVLGIGNAIVDLICKVDDDYLIKNGLTKSTMKLINEEEFKKLSSNLKIEKTIAGGSVANSIVGLAQLKNEVSFIGKINDDKFGLSYEKSLISENVKYYYNKKKEQIQTGICLILITPDSERTMCTFLGISGKITPNDLKDDEIRKSEIIFLEGYLWDKGSPMETFNKALSLKNKSAMTLSDKFCVDRHKDNFLHLVKNDLDITFANEQEILSLIDGRSFEDAVNFAREQKKLIVITRSDKGSIAINGTEVVECNSLKNLKIIDLTGAGDLFAAGFLHGYINKKSIKESLEKGTELASKVIQIIGARLA
jgi:sugar/nucleoside kinase (ribokinase family)